MGTGQSLLFRGSLTSPTVGRGLARPRATRSVWPRPRRQTHFLSGKKTGLTQKKAPSRLWCQFLSTAVRSDDNQSPSFRCRCSVRFRWPCATSRGGWCRNIGAVAAQWGCWQLRKRKRNGSVRWMLRVYPLARRKQKMASCRCDLTFSLEIQKAFLFAKRKVVWPRCGTVRPRRPQAVKFPIPVQG